MCQKYNLELLPGDIRHLHLHINCSGHLALEYNSTTSDRALGFLNVILVVTFFVQMIVCYYTHSEHTASIYPYLSETPMQTFVKRN